MHWFTKDWWEYLLAPISNARSSSSLYWQARARLKTASCRARGHPYGVYWYKSTGMEPDMTCNNCGDDLG